MSEPPALFASAAANFGSHVHAITDGQWGNVTPCEDWDVRALVNHVAVEDLWAAELFGGRTIVSVGNEFDGDKLGADPKRGCDNAVDGAISSIARPGAMTQTVDLSFGATPGSEYAMQLFADHLIHAWDLATALGRDAELDPQLVHECYQWFRTREAVYRQAGIIGPAVDVPDDSDETTMLLARFGRSV
jgi:uncharacterized protein (TIGR03086 family)